MFIQVITANVTDPEGLLRQRDRWESEIRPGAVGVLGSTGGITSDGRFVIMARFASEADARRNSERAEQGQWWAETEKMLRDVEFKDSVEVKTPSGGGTDDAGFVQVMRGHVKDADRLAAMEATMAENEPAMRKYRPDVLGQVIAMHADGTYTNAVYFSSEAEARAGETSPPPPEIQAAFADMEAAVTVDEYLDLTEPWLR
ncbi:MAG: hypothetical protein U0V73_10660 [Acidimicrobiia bacterium]